jgi:hypothetical protein
MAPKDEDKEKRAFPREKVRALCHFEVDGEIHSGFLLNLSPRGMFLQTRLKLTAGTELTVKIRDLGDEPIELLARVVHLKSAHRATSAVETGGVGMQILNAPESLYRLLLELGSP